MGQPSSTWVSQAHSQTQPGAKPVPKLRAQAASSCSFEATLAVPSCWQGVARVCVWQQNPGKVSAAAQDLLD
jgi:hypothetical protein